jgi:hypothetical protein
MNFSPDGSIIGGGKGLSMDKDKVLPQTSEGFKVPPEAGHFW